MKDLGASEHVVYTVFADDGGEYAWIKRPGDRSPGLGGNCADTFSGMANTWLGDHPISASLEAALADWQRLYEGTNATADGEPAGGWRAFNKRGLELAIALKRELGPEVRVRYAGHPAQPELAHGRWMSYVSEAGPFVPREIVDRMRGMFLELEVLSPLAQPEIETARHRALLHVLGGQYPDSDALRYYRLVLGIASGETPERDVPRPDT